MVATTDFLKDSLEGVPKEDLNTVQKNVQDELKRRRTVKDLIEELRIAYSKIDYGQIGRASLRA